MADGPITTVPGWWALAACALLTALGLYAATLDHLLSAQGARTALFELARLMRQRRRTTVAADTLLWRVGGGGLIVVASLMVAVVPVGRWALADLDVGVVWFNAMDVTLWALVWLCGWGPNSAHSLVGGYRFLAHGLGYELPLMFALVAPAIAAKSLRVGEVVSAQHGLWFAAWMPVAFAVYCLGVVAFSVWGPFGPALGSDIAGGVTAELSGVDRLMFQAGRHALLAAGAAFAVPMFLGGGAGPWLPDWAWVMLKTVAVLSVLVWLRARTPALRPDKFMEIGWIVLLPLTVVQDFVVAVVAVRN
ncbi:NADH-quinone oxidoreductase subunit H [Mycobacterium simiae]|uniref:NADH-quinone oxidoreductase subunit H n=1 Tax=Mycobacterium simiae TaxID=1784 RepID=A0A5B1BQQ2_MYCSI|nr:complex I subunit 1 family protein [Mycobacterium simiae]KAA1249349.1 NADH-quinone oxidoreductase subunit H [Mycobacterium simiae]